MKHKILVIDDEPEIVKILEQFLTKSGFKVITAPGGDEGLKVINSRERLDLIILDMKMPKTKGFDVLKKMQENDIKIPTIILSGSIDMQRYSDDLKTLGYNYQDALIKPVDLKILLGKVEDKLGLKS